MPLKKGFNKEMCNRIQENIVKLVQNRGNCLFLFKREYFKMYESINWEENRNKYSISSRLLGHLASKQFTQNKIIILGIEQVNSKTFETLFGSIIDENARQLALEKKSSLALAVKKKEPDHNDLDLLLYILDSNDFKLLSIISLLTNEYIIN